ncbi:hypothetical protein GQ457_06G000410 [Hibiscus cannabinus]
MSREGQDKDEVDSLLLCGTMWVSRGLALWWSNDTQIIIIRSGKHFIDAKISVNGETEWFSSFIYGPPYREEKREFWEMMTNLRSVSEDCWLVIDDTNVVASQEEKLGRVSFNPSDAKVYFDFIDGKSLLDYRFPEVRSPGQIKGAKIELFWKN